MATKDTTTDTTPDTEVNTDPTSTNNDAEVQAIDIKVNEGSPAAKADVTVEHIVADPQADVLAWDPPAISNGDPTVPRADSHDPRPAN